MGKKGSAVQWMRWGKFDVAKWMEERGLERYAVTFVENGIEGKNLPDCLDETMLARKAYTHVRNSKLLTFCR